MSRSPRLRVPDAVSLINQHSLPISVSTTHDGHIRFRFFDDQTLRDRLITVANGRPTLLVPPVLARVIQRGVSPPPAPTPPPVEGVAFAPLARGANAPLPPRIRLLRALALLRKDSSS